MSTVDFGPVAREEAQRHEEERNKKAQKTLAVSLIGLTLVTVTAIKPVRDYVTNTASNLYNEYIKTPLEETSNVKAQELENITIADFRFQKDKATGKIYPITLYKYTTGPDGTITTVGYEDGEPRKHITPDEATQGKYTANTESVKQAKDYYIKNPARDEKTIVVTISENKDGKKEELKGFVALVEDLNSAKEKISSQIFQQKEAKNTIP